MSTLPLELAEPQSAPPAWQRSEESHAFESYWRSLRNADEILPERSAFRLSGALRFLRDLIVIEAPGPNSDSMRIRLWGERPHDLAGRNLAGCDFLDLLPERYHPGAVATARLMLERPCGIWQISPLHLARGYAQRVEVTAFPLAAGENGIATYLGQLLPIERPIPVTLPVSIGLAIDTAVDFHFIDIGAGIPAWPAEAA